MYLFVFNLEIKCKLLKTEDHLDIATIISNIASMQNNLNQFELALKSLKRAYGKEWVFLIFQFF